MTVFDIGRVEILILLSYCYLMFLMHLWVVWHLHT